MSARMLRAPLALALLAAFAAHGAVAQSTPIVSGNATISTGAGNGATGAITINETAGLDNAQSNQLALGTGALGAGYVGLTQSATAHAHVGDTTTRIDGSAFSNISGALMVNQSAGAGNLQRNSTVLGTLGAEVRAVSDTELSETAPGHGGPGLPVGGRGVPEASISGDAFKHISGIVQVNQTSGAGNATANSFVLRPPAGTLFN
ncbi:hypothetical protein [Burkholderia ubonensis]|uniref:Adhesin n=1 Tax=Burkholderia ubonensis subsp. mesacidophila TaxID=265293 RepID=A0A2A4F6C8_9BURK|nr:hypothetical protein [Burkholderia ubonensis]PCE28537.1 hypothetical protein BZL54_28850 [Burkholderia ubonensis subsp. mesacidophila]